VVVGPETQEEVGKRRVVNAGKETRFFVLPLSVEDDAGNRAESQLRFSVEEVSLFLQIPPPGTGGRNRARAPAPLPPTPARFVAPVVKVEEKEEEAWQDKKEEERRLAERKATAAATATAAAVPSPLAHQEHCDSAAEPEVKKEEEFEGGAVLLVILLILFCVMAWIYTSTSSNDDGVIPHDVIVGGDAYVYHESPTPNSRRNSFGSPGGVGMGLSPYASPRVYT